MARVFRPVRRFRAQVNNPVASADQVELVLDDDYCVPLIGELLEDSGQVGDIAGVQAGRRLVEQNSVCWLEGLASSAASLTRCASPPRASCSIAQA